MHTEQLGWQQTPMMQQPQPGLASSTKFNRQSSMDKAMDIVRMRKYYRSITKTM